MCGIAGIVAKYPVDRRAVEHMNLLQKHRGPDDSGVWSSASSKIILGHRRLSIIDLSAAGHQPMVSGSHVITFNGEIYNFREIASKLRNLGVTFFSDSDTEVLLKAYQQWGVKVLDELNGMFSFAIYDEVKKSLFCGRDRFGEKPFLFHMDNHSFIFASEYKALLTLEGISSKYDQERIFNFLYHPTRGLDDDVQTCFEDIKQLPPGHYLILDTESLKLKIQRYWDIVPKTELKSISEIDAQVYLRELLVDSIKLRMRSDVPVGSCLSGGLDSSSIVCLANNMTDIDRPYHVFTGRFPASDADEWVWAKKVIAETSVKPHVVAPTAKDLLRDLNDFVWHNELPVGSSSQFAQWSVFRLAKENGITVLLDGQGGDELLGGYEQYFEKFLASTNSITRAEIRKIKKRYPLALLTNVQKLTNSLPQKLRHFLAGLSGRGSDFSFGLTSELASRLNKRLSRIQTKGSQFNPLVAQLYEEMLHTHLPVLLRYGDRNSMAHSTEVRLPFCDHRLAEFVFSLPVDFLMGGAQTKRMLRGAMKGVLPEDIRTRWGKQGFIPPQENWFKEELGTSVTEIINDHSFKHSKIWRQKWWLNVLERFHSGENHLAAILWRPVINNAWERNFLSRVNSIKKVSIKRDL